MRPSRRAVLVSIGLGRWSTRCRRSTRCPVPCRNVTAATSSVLSRRSTRARTTTSLSTCTHSARNASSSCSQVNAHPPWTSRRGLLRTCSTACSIHLRTCTVMLLVLTSWRKRAANFRSRHGQSSRAPTSPRRPHAQTSPRTTPSAKRLQQLLLLRRTRFCVRCMGELAHRSPALRPTLVRSSDLALRAPPPHHHLRPLRSRLSRLAWLRLRMRLLPTMLRLLLSRSLTRSTRRRPNRLRLAHLLPSRLRLLRLHQNLSRLTIAPVAPTVPARSEATRLALRKRRGIRDELVMSGYRDI